MATAEPKDVSTIIDALDEQVRIRPSRAAFTHADHGEQSLSYSDLQTLGLEAAAGLKNLGMRRGDRVLVCLPTSLDTVVSFYGVLLAGGVCVPVFPSKAFQRVARWRARLSAVSRIVQPAGAIVTTSTRLHMRSVLEEQGEGLFATTPEALLKKGRGGKERVEVEPEDLALVQFTSGTTGGPRGAAITHGSLLANINALVHGMSFDDKDISVSWLPPYHDMGLIGHIFTPVRCAIHQYLLSPQTFIEDPAQWLRQITKVQATQTTAPNAAYEICNRKVTPAERYELDLSSLRWALNGAELVHRGTIDRFCRAFEPCGFSRKALRPVYGLAEATLATTLGPLSGPQVDTIDRILFQNEGKAEVSGADAREALHYVCVGEPIVGHEIKVVDDAGESLGPRRLGMVCFRGPAVMQGYFNNPEATARVLFPDGWLRTFDLGYLDDAGLLYITGRNDEVIIHNGANCPPHDFEAAACSVPGIRAGRAVACGLRSETTGTEEIVVYAEVQKAQQITKRLASQVTEAIVDATGIRPDRVELGPAGVLPKTTSGKLQRSAVKAALESGKALSPPRRHISDAVVPGLRSIKDLLEVRVQRLLGWQ